MTILSCNKEQNGTFTHKVKIYVDQENTKTSINEGSSASFNWSENDNTRFTVKENEVNGTGIGITTSDSWKTINLTATFETEAAAEYTYSAFMAKNKTNSGSPKIPASQTSTATSYDPDADILVGQARSFDDPQTSFSMKFARPVVINKMTLKGLDEGESISSISISADKSLVGYFNTSTNTWTGQGTDITISTTQTVPASGEVTVYFVTMPVDDATLTVSVTTGNFIYSKTFTKTISFLLNRVTVFGVSSLKKDSKSDYSDTYVLINEAGNKMAGEWVSGDFVPAVDVTLEGGVIYYDPDVVNIANAQITVDKITEAGTYFGMYTLTQNGKYLYAAGSGLKGEDDTDVNAYWEISNTAGTWSIEASKSSNNKVMQYNSSSPRFSCYSSASQSAVKLHSADDVAPTPSITADASIALTADAVTSETSTGVTFNSNTSSVSVHAYSDAECTVDATWLTVSTSGSGSSTVVNYTATANNTGAERTEYIKIIATNSASRSVNKVITVTQSSSSGTIYTYTFSSKAWAASPKNWTSVAEGSATGDARGISVQKAQTGASATSPVSYTGISHVAITLSRSGSGAGEVVVKVGSTTVLTRSTFTTTATSYEADVENLDGIVSFVVSCTTSTIYVKDISITAMGTEEIGGGGGSGSSPAEFSYSDFSGQGTSGSGSVITATKNTYITVSSDKGYGDPGHVRIYSGGTITVSATGDKTITKIVFTSTASGTSSNGPSKISASGYSYSGNKGTWTGSSSSIVFSASAQFRFTDIEVTYE